MPTYEIEQYEIYVQRYRVEAVDEVHAVARLFGGEAELVENSLEYVEAANDHGMYRDDDLDIADGLWDLGIIVGIDIIIPSIRSVRLMETQETD